MSRCDKNFNKKEPVLCNLGYVDYIVLASTLSIAFAEDFDASDLNILANFFAVLADELALIASIEVCPGNDVSNEFTPPGVALTSLDLNSKKISNVNA